ncbi:hypothetical protein Baya_2349 [Bagarius yarrelli]|uniref:Uncharacterized protein n=1 Tax=Bagarius yarrelli TaxID=175774 RepID=A0A556TNP6_BAGYA|nr:hypothetical protein Baya_2349 [Bagarius yarrelli]
MSYCAPNMTPNKPPDSHSHDLPCLGIAYAEVTTLTHIGCMEEACGKYFCRAVTTQFVLTGTFLAPSGACSEELASPQPSPPSENLLQGAGLLTLGHHSRNVQSPVECGLMHGSSSSIPL